MRNLTGKSLTKILILSILLMVPTINFAADGNNNCIVDQPDFDDHLLPNMFTYRSPGENWFAMGDFNLDGRTDVSDVNKWLDSQGEQRLEKQVKSEVISSQLDLPLSQRLLVKLDGTTPTEVPFANTFFDTADSLPAEELVVGGTYYTCLGGQTGSLIVKAEASDDFDNPSFMYSATSESAVRAMVLVNGMNVNDAIHTFGVVDGSMSQETLREIIGPDTDSGGNINLADDEVIIAFELNDNPKDYNDLVVRLTLAEGMSLNYEGLGFHVGDAIGVDNVATSGFGGISIIDSSNSAAGFIVSSNGNNKFSEFRGVFGAIDDSFFPGINYASMDFEINIFNESDYFSNGAPLREIPLGAPSNVLTYFNGLPDLPVWGITHPSEEIDTYNLSFDLTGLNFGDLPAGSYVFEVTSDHNANFVGTPVSVISDSPFGASTYGPVAIINNGTEKKLLDASDEVRWAMSIVEADERTFIAAGSALAAPLGGDEEEGVDEISPEPSDDSANKKIRRLKKKIRNLKKNRKPNFRKRIRKLRKRLRSIL